MVQVKKAVVQDAIVEAAELLFRDHGFSATPMAAIARMAGVAVSTIYVYYDSKLALFFAIYEPWLGDRLDDMALAVAREDDPFQRVKSVLEWIWIKIPAQDNYFSNNLMEAISTAGPADAYSDGFLHHVRQRIAGMLPLAGLPSAGMVTPAGQAPASEIALLVIMAFDGFSMKIGQSGHPASTALISMTARMICRELGFAGLGDKPETAA